ncbi:MAG: hypothetical protein MRY64_02750 [Hyphomonadaceae bacterium]|nr:hypothetical protein [Hyphomonadaceae bacterium]
MVGTIGAIFAASMFAHPPEWVYIALLSIFGATVFVTLGIFIFMVAKRPDDLRSEEYLIESQKLSMYRDASMADAAIPAKELLAIPDPKPETEGDPDD